MEISIESEFISTDITAVLIVEDSLIAGIGNYLHVFDILTSREISRTHIFPHGQKIHGLALRNDQLAVFGGRFLQILPYPTLATENKSPHVLPDWVLSVRWLQHPEGSLAVALSHNQVLLWDPGQGSTLSQVTCQERCILYSALLVGETWEDLVVFSGTVFTEILVWGVSDLAASPPSTADRPVWHRVRGHKGVIFSLAYDSTRARLLSCSDDRTVRVWQVDQGTDDVIKWSQVTLHPLHKLYGHSARVWRVRETPQGFISIGEDSVLCQWSAEGEIISRSLAHQGGSIWSLDYSTKHEIIVTGGGDGGLLAWPLGPAPLASPLPTLSSPQGVEDGVRRAALTARGRLLVVTESGTVAWTDTVGPWRVVFEDSRFHSYGLLAVSPCRTKVALGSLQGHVAVLSERPRDVSVCVVHSVCPGKILSLHWLSPELLLVGEVGGRRTLWRLDSYPGSLDMSGVENTLPSLSSDPDTVPFTTTPLPGCTLSTLNLSKVETTLPCPSPDLREHSNLPPSSIKDPSSSTLNLSVVESTLPDPTQPPNVPISESPPPTERRRSPLRLLSSYSLQTRDKGVSAALLVQELDLLILGDPQGGVTLLDIKAPDMVELQRLPRLAGSEGVTCLHLQTLSPSSTPQIAPSTPLVVLAGGKDGRLHTLLLENRGLRVLRSEQTRLGWLVGLRELEEESSAHTLLALAFHREAFTLTSVAQQRPLFSINCGGGHRSWDLLLTEGSLTFCFVRERRVLLASAPISRLIRPAYRIGDHWKTINKMISLPGPESLLVSGSDDGGVRVWRGAPRGVGTCQACPVLGGHVSSVRALLCCTPSCEEPREFLVLSAGGRAQMIAWRISRHGDRVVCAQLASHMLQGEETARRSRRPWADMHFKPRDEPDTRYMDLCELPAEKSQDKINILAACSDGFLRIFVLEARAGALQLTVSLPRHGCCLLRVAALGGLVALGDTKGRVALWSSGDLLENKPPLWEGRLHQSGIDSLSLAPAPAPAPATAPPSELNVRHLLATGGDDNKLAVTSVNLDPGSQDLVTTQWATSQAHAAQITGVCLLGPGLMASTSTDQRVLIWRLEEGDEWTRKGSVVTTVADVQGLEVYQITRGGCKICVYGKGFEILQVSWEV